MSVKASPPARSRRRDVQTLNLQCKHLSDEIMKEKKAIIESFLVVFELSRKFYYYYLSYNFWLLRKGRKNAQ